MTFKKPAIFLSYASEDSAIANVIENALQCLSGELDFGLEITRDVHSFTRGLSLSDQVIEKLKNSDFLFIIYTEALKKSHSYTGFEVGAFRVFMTQDQEKKKKTDRRIVSLYLDEMPAPEQDVLGIKLDIRSLGRADPEHRASLLDRDKHLPQFFCDVVDLFVTRSFAERVHGDQPISGELAAEMTNVQNKKRAFVDEKVTPLLEHGLLSALAAVVASSSIEQKLFEIKWSATAGSQLSKGNVLADAELNASNSDVFRLFGIEQDKTSMSWGEFHNLLDERYPRHSAFILNALDEAARSGLSSGPVDNEQFFISPDQKMYRVIVTRHYAYYDGSKFMNMYFIPMLSRFAEDTSIVLALLNVAVRYRQVFLKESSDFSVRKFRAAAFDSDLFNELIRKYLRQFLLIEDESHVYQLDEPSRYFEIYDNDADPDEVSKAFKTWKDRRKKIIELANKVQRELGTTADPSGLMKNWLEELQSFNDYIEPINTNLGVRATKRLESWFGTGEYRQSVA
jgi:TIR domain